MGKAIQRNLELRDLSEKRGNLKHMAKHKQNKLEPAKAQAPAAELKQLKQENQMLKIENEFLKNSMP